MLLCIKSWMLCCVNSMSLLQRAYRTLLSSSPAHSRLFRYKASSEGAYIQLEHHALYKANCSSQAIVVQHFTNPDGLHSGIMYFRDSVCFTSIQLILFYEAV